MSDYGLGWYEVSKVYLVHLEGVLCEEGEAPRSTTSAGLLTMEGVHLDRSRVKYQGVFCWRRGSAYDGGGAFGQEQG